METMYYKKQSYPENKPTKEGPYNTNLGELYWGKTLALGWTRNIGDSFTLKGIDWWLEPISLPNSYKEMKELNELLEDILNMDGDYNVLPTSLHNRIIEMQRKVSTHKPELSFEEFCKKCYGHIVPPSQLLPVSYEFAQANYTQYLIGIRNKQ